MALIQGTQGDDYIEGGNGDDFLIGNFGNNSLNGGLGTDTAVFRGTTNQGESCWILLIASCKSLVIVYDEKFKVNDIIEIKGRSVAILRLSFRHILKTRNNLKWKFNKIR